MFKNKSVKVILFEIFLIVLGIVGLTLGINYITNVNIKTSSLAIDDMHASVSTGNLSPVADSSINIDTTSNVLRITFEVKGASTNTKNNIIYDVALNLIADCPLKNESVKWNLYKNNSLLTTGNISPSFDKDILEDKLVLTDTQEDLPSYSGTSDKYVFILWLSETCTEEDITKCDLSSVLSGETGNNTVSGNIDIRLNTGKKKPHTRVSSDTDACTILRGNGANAVKYADDGSTGDTGSGVYKVHHDEISADISVTGEVIPAVDDYRYYGANPNNYIQLPDMNTEDGAVSCTYNGEQVTSLAGCNTAYKWDKGNNSVELYDELIVDENEGLTPYNPGTMTWKNNSCVYKSDESQSITINYNGTITEEICNQLSVTGSSAFLIYKLGKPKKIVSTNGLYRIIGSIYDELTGENRLKLIKATILTDGTVNTFAWDYKSDGSYANIWATPTETRNNITNNYSNSTTSGSSLMIMLNSGIWWSDTTNTGKMYDSSNQSGRDVDFTNYKLSSTAKSMIGDSRYYLAEAYPGEDSQNQNGSTMYKMERTGVRNDNEASRYDENRPLYWEGKVGLMYPSDYVLAAGNTCYQIITSESCIQKDWLYMGANEWLQSPGSGGPGGAWLVDPDGDGVDNGIHFRGAVRPVFSLTSDVSIVSGTGTAEDPYQITKG